MTNYLLPEEKLISSVLKGANPHDTEAISEQSFYSPQNAVTWNALVELTDKGIPPTPETVVRTLGDQASNYRIDADRLTNMMRHEVSPDHVTDLGTKVAENAARRLLIDIGYRINQAGVTDKAFAEVYDEARDMMDEIPKHFAYRNKPHLAAREMYPALDWHTIWDEEVEEEWIVYPLLPARRMVSIYSPPKVGKSLLMLEIAAAVATGTEVLGTRPEPRSVLYVDFENDPHQDIVVRLKALGYTPDQLGNLHYLSFPSLPAFDSEQGSKELLSAIEAYEAEVVVIDTVSRAIDGEENENDTWLRFYRHTGLKLKQAGVATVRLDHSGKDETKGQRGGSAKGGDVDAVWRMSTVTKDQTYRLECEMARMTVNEQTLVLHREINPVLRHRVDGAGPKAAFDAKVAEVIRQLDDNAQPDDMGRDTARDYLKGLGVSASTSALSEAVRQRKARVGDRLV